MPIRLAKRDSNRDSRNRMKAGCLSSVPASAGARDDMRLPWTTAVRVSMLGQRMALRCAVCHAHNGSSGDLMLQLQSAFGIVALLAIAWAISENRRAVSPRQAAIGLAATLVIAVILIKLP